MWAPPGPWNPSSACLEHMSLRGFGSGDGRRATERTGVASAPPTAAGTARIPATRAWFNVAVLTAGAVLVIGVPNFVLIPAAVAGRPLPEGSLWFLTTYAGCVAVLTALTLTWWRRTGRTLGDLGWGRPTTRVAVIGGVLFGLLWVGFSLMGVASVLGARVALGSVDLVRVAAAALGLVITVGEEILMRGVLMNELRRGGVSAALQILASGVAFAVYHNVGQFSPLGLLPSLLVGCAWAGIFVLGRRSLTPGIVSHGIVNVAGEPFLAMMILAVR